MKKVNYVHVLMAAGAALCLFAAPSMAADNAPAGAGGGEHGMKHQKGDMQEMDKSLGLNDEQRAKMKTIREEAKTAQEALRTQLKAKNDAIRQELDGATPDRAKAEAMVKEVSALEQQLGLARIDTVFKIRAVLTPEQYQKLQAMHEKKRAEMKEHHGKPKFE